MKQAASAQAGQGGFADRGRSSALSSQPMALSPSSPFSAHFCACLSSLEGATVNPGSRSRLRLLHPVVSFVSGRHKHFNRGLLSLSGSWHNSLYIVCFLSVECRKNPLLGIRYGDVGQKLKEEVARHPDGGGEAG